MAKLFEEFSVSSARFSPDRIYRYELQRTWDADLPSINWLMANPSTADETVLDPTLKRCLAFSRSWGYGSMIITNVFAYRSTDPKKLHTVADPVGPDNDAAIVEVAERCQLIVAGWGEIGGKFPARIRKVQELLRDMDLCCLSMTGSGQPGHPLYLSSASKPIMWP